MNANEISERKHDNGPIYVIDQNNNTEKKGIDKKERQIQGWSRFRITIEPVMFLIGFATSFTSGVTVDLIENIICQHTYNISEMTCHNISPELRAKVDSKTATMNMWINIMDGVFPALISIFIGPWSDTNGRKIPLLLPIMGYSLSQMLYGVLSLFPQLPIVTFLIPPIVLSVTGSENILIITTANYICAIFPTHERAIRFSLRTCFQTIGSLIGNAIATQIFKVTGRWSYQIVYSISFFASSLAGLYTLFCIQETKRNDKEKRTNLLELSHLKRIVRAITDNPKKGRIVVLLLMLCLLCEITTTLGDSKITFLVGKSEYYWTLGDYYLFTGVIQFIKAVCPLTLLWLMRGKLKLPRRLLMVIFSVFLMCSELFRSFNESQMMFWMASVFMPFGTPAADIWDEEFYCSLSTKESGNASALFSTLQAIATLISPPIYSELYKYLLPNRTTYVFLASATIISLSVIASIILLMMEFYTQQKNKVNDSRKDP